MSVILPYTVPGNDLSQLHDELLRASLIPEVVQGDGDDIILTMPDGTVEAEVDAVVAAHVPMTRYDPTTQLAAIAATRDVARLRADYARVLALGDAIVTLADAKVCLRHLVEVLKRRDRAAGIGV